MSSRRFRRRPPARPPGAQPPASPTGLTATVRSATRIDLAATVYPAGATLVRWQVSPAGAGTWADVGTTAPGIATIAAEGLTAETTYDFRVRAEGPGGNSAWSGTATATTLSADAPTLLASVTLTNPSGSATPARTLVTFGHPFEEGSIPTGSHLAATWAVDGIESAVPLQIDGISAWPDGSIRFGSIKVSLPSVAGSGSGVLNLLTRSGAASSLLPGNRTAAQIVAELEASHVFTVSVASLTRGYTPVADGTGSWSWSSASPLSLLGGVDGRGRTRCEVIESGPLCLTVRCWAPFREGVDGSGSEHPQLACRAWYRCFLDPATGAITSVQYIHSLRNGWIADLTGGATVSDLQIGNFTLGYNGSPVPGRSWTATRVPHHTLIHLAAVNSSPTSANWADGGMDRTSDGHSLYPTFDPVYFIRTGLVPNYDLDFYATHGMAAATPDDSNAIDFVPGPTTDAGRMVKADKKVDAGGEHKHIGVLPNWDAKALIGQSPTYHRGSIVTALASGTLPCCIENDATARIPVVVGSGTFSSAALGANMPGTYYSKALSRSANIKIAAVRNGPTGITDPLGTEAGWDGYDSSHFPSLAYYPYLITGAPHFAETILHHTNLILLQNGNRQNFVMPSGATAPNATWNFKGSQPRSEAWSWKIMGQALAVLPDERAPGVVSQEKLLFRTMYNANSAAMASEIGLAPANWRNNGFWIFPLKTPMEPSGPDDPITGDPFYLYNSPPWQYSYMIMSRAYCIRALGSTDPGAAGTMAYLEHAAKFLEGMATRADGYYFGQYQFWCGAGTTGTDYFASWDDVANEDQVPAYFDATAASTGWITGLDFQTLKTATPIGLSSPDILQTANSWKFQAGDEVFFYFRDKVSDLPPSPLRLGVWYTVADVDVGAERIRLEHPDTGLPITSYPASGMVVAMGSRLAAGHEPPGTSTGNFNPHFQTCPGYGNVAESAALASVVCGVIEPDAAWLTNVMGRNERMRVAMSPTAMQTDARWKYSLTIP